MAWNDTTTEIFGSLIALPPLAEQIRIVQKVDELMQYCNDLKASIKESESQNEKLLQQVLREALSQPRSARGKEVVGV
jgi:type I restriction enzyme S subunit